LTDGGTLTANDLIRDASIGVAIKHRLFDAPLALLRSSYYRRYAGTEESHPATITGLPVARRKPLPGHDIIVVGASAGGVEALTTLVRGLPADLPAALFIVLHIPPQSTSVLPAILNRASPLLATHAKDGAAIEHGRIYVAPPDYHLMLEHERVRVVRGPKENRHRPAVDPLFRTVAFTYGPRVVGVVLTGSLDDGTAGLMAVKRRGGVAIVQDPNEALYPSMPRSAMENVEIDYCLPLAKIAPTLVHLANEQAEEEGAYPVPNDMEMEARIARLDLATLEGEESVGQPSVFSCPECSGVLYEIHDGELIRFRCRVGHAFSVESVLAEQAEALEQALWAALNTLEESVSLSRRMAQYARDNGRDWLASRFEEKVQVTSQRAALIRQVLMKGETLWNPTEADQDAAGE
jgi:two-component system chemotaxis response regulator CheB